MRHESLTRRTRARAAFTLVELAVVLVIVGLIVGGILIGQDLIKSAVIRASITDLEKFNAGATAFTNKYNGLPGDLQAARAIEFGFSASGDANASGADGLRDGNQAIEGAAAGATNLAGEIALFWRDLGQVGLVGRAFTGLGGGITPGVAVTAATIGTYLPGARLRENVSYFAYSRTGRNFFYIGSITSDAAGVVTTGPSITTLEAQIIDEKIDDGFPTTGIAVTMSNLATEQTPVAEAKTACTQTGTPPAYNVDDGPNGAGSAQVCQLRVRSSF